MSSLLDQLPAFYRRFLPEYIAAEPVQSETKATCANCAMCKTAETPQLHDRQEFFRPDAKCCTYHPSLPNFLIGGLLQDPNPALAEGRRRVEGRIARRSGVTPLEVDTPAKYRLIYDNAKSAFGRSKGLVCPYLDDGRCSIWAYREAVCSTYFCKHVAGADGKSMWMSLKMYLSIAEKRLAQYALLQVAPELLEAAEDPDVRALRAAEIDDVPGSEEDHTKLWGSWAGRESELYVACYNAVVALDRDTFERIVGIEGSVQLGYLKRAVAKAKESNLPERVRVSFSVNVSHTAEDQVAITGQGYELIGLPREVWDLLPRLGPRDRLAEARERLDKEQGVVFEDDLLHHLLQQRILVPADAR